MIAFLLCKQKADSLYAKHWLLIKVSDLVSLLVDTLSMASLCNIKVLLCLYSLEAVSFGQT